MVIPVAMVTYQPPVHKSIHLVLVHGIDNGVKTVQYKLNTVCTVLKRGCAWLTCFYEWCVCVHLYVCVWTSCMPPDPLFLCSLPSIQISLFCCCVCVYMCVCVCMCVCSVWVCAGYILSTHFVFSTRPALASYPGSFPLTSTREERTW